jgi:2-oxoglutarate ferredoxin oxidoreductase subunit beta
METTAMMDFVPLMREITATYEAGDVSNITMHDGSAIRLHKLEKDWDPLDRISAMNAVQRARAKGEILTGLLYVDPDSSDLHELIKTTDRPLNTLTKNDLCPGTDALAKINAGLR